MSNFIQITTNNLKKAVFLSTIVLLAFSACNTDNSGYKTTDNGLKFKYLKENAQGVHPKVGDFVEIKLIYANENDSILFKSDEISPSIKMSVNKPDYDASFEEALIMLKTGEHALFKIPANLFFSKTKKVKIPDWVKKGENLTFDIQLIRILDKKQVKKEEQIHKESLKKAEDESIQQYIQENNIKEESSISGLYYIEIQKGKGKNTVPGNILQVHYTGKFIDGSVFDSSLDRNELFSFQYGNSEVIAGWEEGFSRMKEGGKAKFIIPSHLAYGENGYGKIIPPFSTLIFDVELVKIK